MKVLVIGGGGREHAIIAAVSRSPKVEKIFAAPGNAGIAALAECVAIKDTDVDALVTFAYNNKVDLTIVGPEASLALGIVDAFEAHGLKIFGPKKAAAQVEVSKDWAKNVMAKYGVPTARFQTFSDYGEALEYIHKEGAPIVLKYDGLAAGKGVVVAETMAEAEAALKDMLLDEEFGKGSVVIEECLRGTEFSFMCLVDGKNVLPLPIAKDHKRAYDGDKGPNTGGMGAVSPVSLIPNSEVEWSYNNIMCRMAEAMVSEGCPFSGLLYGGLMLTKDGVKVIEFNARFGDPEAMNVLTLLDSDFVTIAEHIVSGTLTPADVSFRKQATVCKYIVPKNYPEHPHAGDPITLGPHENTILYYANVMEEDGVLKTQTSRTIAFVGVGATLTEAEKAAESACRSVSGNVRHRTDIGTEALFAKRIAHMKELRG